MSAFLTPPTPAASGGTDHGTSSLRWGTSWVQTLNAAVNANATTALATLTNTSTGASANAKLALGADIGGIEVGINGSGYSSTGTYGVATEAFVRGNGSSAGLYLNAGAGVLRFGVADIEVGRWASDGLVAGAGDASATPGAGVLRGTKATGTNIAGSNLTITPGLSTGSGVGGSLVLQAGTTGSAGSAQNAAVTRVTLAPAGTTLAGAVTADTSIWNIGSGQIYKDASGNLGVGTTSPGAKIQAGGGTAGTAALYIRAFGSATGGDIYIGQSGGAIFGLTAGTAGFVLQNANAPLGIATLSAQPLYFGTGGSATTNARLGIGSTGDIAIGKGVTAAQARLEVAGGTFALTDSGLSWAASKFDSQGVARNTLTSPSIVLNGSSSDRPEIAWYRGARTYPEFAIRESTTADSGGEIWAGGGVVSPIKTITINSSVVGILAPTTQVGSGDNSAAPGNSTLRGSDGSGTNISGASITIQAGRGTGTGTPGPGFLSASSTTTSGTTLQAAANVAQWTSAGLHVVNSGATLGYTTGAGGTVTQATSKATGVTLNRPSGQITTAADSLAANTRQRFTLTNSVITANSVVIAHRKSGGTDGAYEVLVDSVAAGSCVLALTNSTAGALAEAVTISFIVLNGATA